MFVLKKSLTRVLLVSSLIFTANVFQSISSLSQPVDSDKTRASILSTTNQYFNTRVEALNAIKTRGFIPASQQFISQWQSGGDSSKVSNNYVLDKNRQSSWGNYYLYKVTTQKVPYEYIVIAEHINDPDAPCTSDWPRPCKHFHVGVAPPIKSSAFNSSKTPDVDAITFFKSTDKETDYDQIGSKHHYFYKGN
jgi:HNH/Endo VII superfamily nuclease toxins